MSNIVWRRPERILVLKAFKEAVDIADPAARMRKAQEVLPAERQRNIRGKAHAEAVLHTLQSAMQKAKARGQKIPRKPRSIMPAVPVVSVQPAFSEAHTITAENFASVWKLLKPGTYQVVVGE